MTPKVFISYSHDSDDYKLWVRSFADRLIADGVETIIDQYDLALGDMLPHFMEKGIASSDFVLLLVTPEFTRKALERGGGVGFEIDVATGEIVVSRNRRKYIPVYIKQDPSSAPSFLKGALGIVIRDLFSYEQEYTQLYRAITGQSLQKPTLGKIRKIDEETPDSHPFNFYALGKGKGLAKWCSWDVIMRLDNMPDLSGPALNNHIHRYLIKENIHGYIRTEPPVLSASNRRSMYPTIVYECGDYSSYANISIFDRIVLSQGQLRYSFVEMKSDEQFYHSAEIAEEALLILLLTINQIHADLSRTVQISTIAKIGSSSTVFFMASSYPFEKYQRISQSYLHNGGFTQNLFLLNSLGYEDIERFFNSIYEMFVSPNVKSEVPFLCVIRDSLYDCITAVMKKMGIPKKQQRQYSVNS